MYQKRKSQEKVVQKIIDIFDSGKNNVFLCAPTGSGKSGIGYCLHSSFRDREKGHKSLLLNHQKVLVDQYSDFLGKEKDVLCIKGKDNYICELNGERVSKAPCSLEGFQCTLKEGCEYWEKRRKFNTSPLAITNYQFSLSLYDVDGFKRESNLCIYDEAHNLEQIFTDYRKLYISTLEINKYERIRGNCSSLKDIPELFNTIIWSIKNFNTKKYIESFSLYYTSIKNLLSRLSNLESEIKAIYIKDASKGEKIISFISEEKRKLCKWSNYKNVSKNAEWVFEESSEEDKKSYQLLPLKIDKLLPEVLDKFSKNRVFMSATILDWKEMAKNLGLCLDQCEMIELDSDFPIQNRETYFLDSLFVTYNTIQSGYAISTCKEIVLEILQEHRNHSGFIYTPSFYLCNMIREEIREEANSLGFKILFNSSGLDSSDVLEEFRAAREKYLLFSPSFSEGVNFNDDISRFQIIVKCPYKSLGSNYVRQRLKRDKKWYELDALTKILQASGRSVRSREDWATTYVLDKNCTKLLRKYRESIPKWYRDSILIS